MISDETDEVIEKRVDSLHLKTDNKIFTVDEFVMSS